MAKDSNQPQNARVCLGKIAGSHGVKGLVKITPYGDDPSLIETLGAAYTSKDGSDTIEIALKSAAGKHILALVKGVNDRDQSDLLRGTELYYDRDALPTIDEDDTFYYDDLVGMDAVDENGNVIGSIKAVVNYGAGELLEVRIKGGKELLVPFTDQYVPKVSDTVTLRDYESLII